MAAASARVSEPEIPHIETGAIGKLFASPHARNMITPLLGGVSYEAVISETHILVRKKPYLLKCTGESILMSVAECLHHQLVFGDTAHMVPFHVKVKYLEDGLTKTRWEDRAQFVIGWRGAIELVIRSGAARDVDAQCVYENELEYADERKNFWVRYGSDQDVHHYPQLREDRRGAFVGAYGVARLNQTQKKVFWMDAAELEDHRQKYASKENKEGPIKRWWARKTLVLQVCGRLPKSPALQAAMALIHQHDADLRDVEEVQAKVSDASPLMLTEGPAQPLRVLSDAERIELANRELEGGSFDDDPRGHDGHKVPF